MWPLRGPKNDLIVGEGNKLAKGNKNDYYKTTMQAVPENQATKQVRREHANQDKNILQAHLHQVP